MGGAVKGNREPWCWLLASGHREVAVSAKGKTMGKPTAIWRMGQ